MSFPAYEDYDDSGDELLGLIPTQWGVWKLAHAFMQIGSGTTPKSDKREYYDEGTIPWVNTGDLDDGPLTDCTKKITEKAVEDHSTLKQYPAGSLLFAMYGATIGRLGLLEFPATVNQACCVFSGESPINIKFLFYWFLGLRKRILSLATGGGQPNVSQDILRTLRVACPDDEEQRSIASFLNTETSKIDGLVSEQRRLIELLKEKRQAVISHAVTKGLNPDVKMKPSGIQWLGEVPEHWEVLPLKRLGSIRYGIGEPPKYHDDGTPLIRATNVRSGVLTPVGLVFVHPDEIPEQRIVWLEAGDIIVVRSGAGTGDSAIIPKEYGRAIAGFDMVLRLRGANAWFIQFVLLSKYVREGQIDVEKMRAAQPHLNAEELGGCDIVLPPKDEQAAIVEHLLDQTQRFDTLQAQAERAIELLQERRTALISAAVTGKIDVRGYKPEETVA